MQIRPSAATSARALHTPADGAGRTKEGQAQNNTAETQAQNNSKEAQAQNSGRTQAAQTHNNTKEAQVQNNTEEAQVQSSTKEAQEQNSTKQAQEQNTTKVFCNTTKEAQAQNAGRTKEAQAQTAALASVHRGPGGVPESHLLALRAQIAELEATMQTQKREMALQMETLAAERDLARKQRDALHERVDDAEVALAKALQELPRLRDLEQAHLSCPGRLQEEKAARQAAQDEAHRLKEMEVLHRSCPDSILILRRKVKDAEEAAEKRLQRQEVALKAAQQAHASCEDTILALQQQLDDALREKSDNSTLSRTSVSPPPPMAPPPPGALAAARLRCGVGLFLAVYDSYHFKAGSIYVEEVMPGGAAADSGLVARNDVIVAVNDQAVTALSQVHALCSGFEGSQVVLELERKGFKHKVRLTRKETSPDSSSLLLDSPVSASPQTQDAQDFGALPYKKNWDQLAIAAEGSKLERVARVGASVPPLPLLASFSAMPLKTDESGPPTSRGIHCRCCHCTAARLNARLVKLSKDVDMQASTTSRSGSTASLSASSLWRVRASSLEPSVDMSGPVLHPSASSPVQEEFLEEGVKKRYARLAEVYRCSCAFAAIATRLSMVGTWQGKRVGRKAGVSNLCLFVLLVVVGNIAAQLKDHTSVTLGTA